MQVGASLVFSSKLPADDERKSLNLTAFSGLPSLAGVTNPLVLPISPRQAVVLLVGVLLVNQRRALFDGFFIEPLGTGS
ncbi:MAG: hypothetical protein QM703_23125 [Gemmatales bacterium]